LLLTVGATIALSAAAPAGATPARALALSAGDYLEDDSAVFRWPGSARDHAGRGWLDSGRLDPREGWTTAGQQPRTGPAAGLVWNPDDGRGPWTVGFAVHARAADGDHVGLHRDGPGAAFTWLAGRAVGPVDLTATWRRVSGRWSSAEDARRTFEHRRDDLALGARFDLSPRSYADLAIDCRRQRNRVQAPDDPALWETGNLASWRSWSARARAFIALNPRTVLTPAAEFLREDFSGPLQGETWRPATVMDHDNRLGRLGLALCWLPDPDRLLAVTGEYLDLRSRHTWLAGDDSRLPQTDHLSALSLRVAAEQRLNWWLSLRASLSLTRVRNLGTGVAAVPDDAYLDPAGGAALHLGRWGADLTAAGAPLPEPWRWLTPEPRADLWLRASIHRDF
jgi:hypothetical protein